MTKELIKKRIMEEPDFIKCVKYSNSLNKYLAENEDIDDFTIGRLLMLSEEQVVEIYQEAVDFLKKNMVESEEEK